MNTCDKCGYQEAYDYDQPPEVTFCDEYDLTLCRQCYNECEAESLRKCREEMEMSVVDSWIEGLGEALKPMGAK
jgi:hypothetical protein